MKGFPDAQHWAMDLIPAAFITSSNDMSNIRIIGAVGFMIILDDNVW